MPFHDPYRVAVPALELPLEINALTAWGHSVAVGTGAPAGNGCIPVLGRMLKATVTNNAIAGSYINSQGGSAGNGGLNTILQTFVPGRTAAPRLNGQAATAAGVPLHVITTGFNDLTNFDQPQAAANALRAAICHLRSAQLFESTNAVAGVTYGPVGLGTDWGAAEFAYTAQNTGTGVRTAQLAGATVTLTTPADFEGGYAQARWGNNPTIGTGTVGFAVDGVAVVGSVCAASDAYAGQTAYYARRFQLTPGVHTVRLTVPASMATSMYFDSFAIEATHPPLIHVPPIYRLPDYSTAAIGTLPQQPSDTRIDAFNAAFRAVVAEFDSRVLCPRTEGVLLRAGAIYTDGAHPSELGHRVLAGQFAASIGEAITLPELAVLV